MSLPDVTVHQAHVAAHNNERHLLNGLQNLTDSIFLAKLEAMMADVLPSGGETTVHYDVVNGWPDRPDVDGTVHWMGGTASTPPTTALNGDYWDRPVG